MTTLSVLTSEFYINRQRSNGVMIFLIFILKIHRLSLNALMDSTLFAEV